MQAKPAVTRRQQQLLEHVVTAIDPFRAHRYLHHREDIPRILQIEQEGQHVIPRFEGVLADLYYTLWSPDPDLKENVAPDRRYWQEMLRQMMQTALFEQFHAYCQLKELESILGTIALSDSIIQAVPEEDRERLQQVSKAQREFNDLQEQAEQMQKEANTLQGTANVLNAQARNNGQSVEGGDAQRGQSQSQFSDQAQMTVEQAKARADLLAKQAAHAQAGATIVQQLAAEARADAERLVEELLGSPDSQRAIDKKRELARLGLAALKKAQSEVRALSETVQAWGVEPGTLTRETYADVEAIQERLKRNPALKNFAKLLGKMTQIATRKARSKDKGEGRRVNTFEVGDDLTRLDPSELSSLSVPALRIDALIRWSRGELSIEEEEILRELGEGPFIVCEDSSGSMDGLKRQWTKALLLALAEYAKQRKRTFGWLLFDTVVHTEKIYPKGLLTVKDRLEISESRAGGGTDFEPPLRNAIEMIKKENLKKADILLISDGMCAVSQKFLLELLAVKKALEVTIFVVLVNVGQATDKTVKEFADKKHIIAISKLTAEEAGENVIALL